MIFVFSFCSYRSYTFWLTLTTMATCCRSSPSRCRTDPRSSWRSSKDTTTVLVINHNVLPNHTHPLMPYISGENPAIRACEPVLSMLCFCGIMIYNNYCNYCTLFLQGFGAGNFKSLFEAIELDQAARGNLTELSK